MDFNATGGHMPGCPNLTSSGACDCGGPVEAPDLLWPTCACGRHRLVRVTTVEVPFPDPRGGFGVVRHTVEGCA